MAETNKRRVTIIAGLTVLVLLLGTVASVRFYGRLDLTKDKAMSISKVSRNLFKEIPEQVRLTYYVSGKLLAERPEPQRVEDMLREYAAVSHGKIRVQVIDPDKSGDAETIQSWGITPRQYQVEEQSQFSVANVYTGVAVEYLDRRQVLPFVWDASTLEYDLTRAIRMAVRNSSRVAEVLVGDTGKSWENDYKYAAQALQEDGWEVRTLQPGQDVPDDTGILLVLGNTALKEAGFYPVDQYLMKGGKVLVAARGVDIQTQYGLYALPVAADNAVLSGLKSYGVSISNELVMDKASDLWPFQVQGQSGQAVIVRYSFWVAVQAGNVSKDNPITSKFSGLDLFWASPMTVQAPNGVKAEILAKSSKQAWKSTHDFPVNPSDNAMFTLEQAQTAGQYDMAVALTGAIPSAFAGKPAPTGDGANPAWKGQTPLAASSADARLVVVSSSDFATDIMYYAQATFNASFMSTVADWLGTDDDLLQIKARSFSDNRLNLIQDPGLRNSMIGMVYAIVMGLVPLAVVGYGVFRIVRRKRRAGTATVKGANE